MIRDIYFNDLSLYCNNFFLYIYPLPRPSNNNCFYFFIKCVINDKKYIKSFLIIKLKIMNIKEF